MDYYSFFVGIAASLIVWWLTNTFLSPKISISRKIAKTPSGRFLIGIKNKSHICDICDVYVYARFNFASGNYYSSRIGQILLIERCQLIPKKEKRKDLTSSVILSVDGYRGANGEMFSLDYFFESQENKTKGFVDVYVIGCDGLFGSAKKLCRARYYYDDLVCNSYIKRGSIEVVEIIEDSGTQIKHYDHYN